MRESPEVAAWVQEENAVARAYLDAIPQRPQIERRLTELWNYARYSAPSEKAGKYFFLKNDGLQNQAVLYVADKYDAEGRVLLDPNTWSKDGTVALSDFAAEPRRQAAGLRSHRSRQRLAADFSGRRRDRPSSGPTTCCGLASAISTGTNPAPAFTTAVTPSPPRARNTNRRPRIRRFIFTKSAISRPTTSSFTSDRTTPTGTLASRQPTTASTWCCRSTAAPTDRTRCWSARLLLRPTPSGPSCFGDFKNEFSFVGNEGAKFYFLTDLDAPTKRIVTLDATKPGRESLAEVVPAGKGTIEDANILAGRLIVESLVDVLPQVRVFDLQGKPLGEVKLPGLGSVAGFGGDQDNTETFYIFTSYNTPTVVYRYDVPTNESQVIRRPEVKFNPDDFAVEQAFYHSKDGTRIPMMLAYKKDLPRDKPQPTLLYGYGGFSITIAPHFSTGVPGVDGIGRRGGGGQPSWRRRVRRRLAPGRQEPQQAERLRRFHRRRRMAHQRGPHVEGQAGDHGRQQRRAVGWCGGSAAAGPIWRVHSDGRRDGHAAFPALYGRPILAR